MCGMSIIVVAACVLLSTANCRRKPYRKTTPASRPSHSRAGGPSVPDIGFRRIASHHSLAVEDGPDLADRLFHHPNPAGAIRVIKRQDGVFELAVEVRGMRGCIWRIFVASDGPAGHAFIPALDPPPV